MSVNKQYIEILQQQGFISDVIYYENEEVLRIITLLAEKSEEWQAIKMFMEAPILIDADEDNFRTAQTKKVDKANRTRIKNLLKEKDENLFQAYQANKMRKNFVANILPVLLFMIDDSHQSRFDELQLQFTGTIDPVCFSPRAYEYEMSNERKREFMASFISLIEDVAKSAIAGQPTS